MLSFVPDSVRTARSTRSPPSGAAQLEHYGLVSFVRVVVVVDCDDVVCAPATPVIIPSATAAVMIYLAMRYLSCCDCRDRYPGHVHNLANMNVLLQVRLILIFLSACWTTLDRRSRVRKFRYRPWRATFLRPTRGRRPKIRRPPAPSHRPARCPSGCRCCKARHPRHSIRVGPLSC